MAVSVKICGLKTASAMEIALEAGADYVGLVFFPKSPRNVTLDVARSLVLQARGRAASVGLLVDPDDGLLDAVVGAAAPDMIQLHGTEAPERVAAVRRRAGRPVIKAARIGGADDVRAALAYFDAADLVLFDAKPLAAPGALPGGNGAAFDWRALSEVKHPSRFMLSGGLTADNVRAAIALTGAPAVDVSSGVERRPGEKDGALVRRFIHAAKSG